MKGMKVKDLPTPAFVINRSALVQNCRAALQHAAKHKLKLRPHVKTHKTVEGAYIQATGCETMSQSRDKLLPSSVVSGFVASTLPEVAMLVDGAAEIGGPFRDILFGVPISKSKLLHVDMLRKKLAEGHIHILLDHEEQVRQVEEYYREVCCTDDQAPPRFTAFLKLDTGYRRAGVPCDKRGVAVAVKIIESCAIELVGVYSHCGHAYDENIPSKRDEIATTDVDQVRSFLDQLSNAIGSRYALFSINDLSVSVGSTPSLSHHYRNDKIKNLEIHPGNYTLYDRQQLWTGACLDKACVAGRVVSTVIGHYEDRNTIMLDAGATALTKDTSPQGGMCEITGFPELECHRMSQEVTLARPKDPNARCPFSSLRIGNTVALLPNHSCLSAACFMEYYIIDDPEGTFAPEQPVIDVWKPVKYFSVKTCPPVPAQSKRIPYY